MGPFARSEAGEAFLGGKFRLGRICRLFLRRGDEIELPAPLYNPIIDARLAGLAGPPPSGMPWGGNGFLSPADRFLESNGQRVDGPEFFPPGKTRTICES